MSLVSVPAATAPPEALLCVPGKSLGLIDKATDDETLQPDLLDQLLSLSHQLRSEDLPGLGISIEALPLPELGFCRTGSVPSSNLERGLCLSRETPSGPAHRLSSCRSDLSLIQFKLQSDPLNPAFAADEKRLSKELSSLSLLEESFLRQKSRSKWLELKDSNSAYFHRTLKARQNSNSNTLLVFPDGTSLTSPTDIKEAASSSFSTLFNPSLPSPSPIPPELIDKFILPTLFNSLIAIPSDDDISQVILSHKPNKAPGPDGFSMGFFLSNWDSFKGEVFKAIRSFFFKPGQLAQINQTSISLCNLIHKFIAKILANRIKAVIPSLVSPNQSAIISGRSITDNIILYSEIVRGFDRKSHSPTALLKIDLHKAFDSIRWDFICDVLSLMGFPPVFIHWIHAYISSPSFSVLVNGSPDGLFRSKVGIRQPWKSFPGASKPKLISTSFLLFQNASISTSPIWSLSMT
ncbi:uncharacterized protein LOC122645221 [Telopea speciosissima]|uniref:uncharacterized protein LOC122645221 n=1 Tax=Telopea speciosissima TaxID=54955 RepID=UPI001CC81F1B|nr:uncharacterized protein LOC122645221 [Telopea speciosissima]